MVSNPPANAELAAAGQLKTKIATHATVVSGGTGGRTVMGVSVLTGVLICLAVKLPYRCGNVKMPNEVSQPMSRVNPDWLTRAPIAHRGLHQAHAAIYENTLSACRAAVEAGFSIEVDLHPSADNVPMVFHDLQLERMTGLPGEVRDHTAAELARIPILDSGDHIASLSELLDLVAGRVGLVLELKGVHGRDDGFVEAVANTLKGYEGPVAIMSFMHWLLRDARRDAGHLPLGLVAEGGDEKYDVHKMIFDEVAPDFISYDVENLDCRFVREARAAAIPVITWTVTSTEQMARALDGTDQITFEGFDPHEIGKDE